MFNILCDTYYHDHSETLEDGHQEENVSEIYKNKICNQIRQ